MDNDTKVAAIKHMTKIKQNTENKQMSLMHIVYKPGYHNCCMETIIKLQEYVLYPQACKSMLQVFNPFPHINAF